MLLGLSIIFSTDVEGATVFTDQTLFLDSIGNRITDNYENPAYVFNQSNAQMNAVLNETRYQPTTYANSNSVFQEIDGKFVYCAGCNGSFTLTFTQTTVGNSNGVFAVGFDIARNIGNPQYTAFVTFGDGSTANYLLPIVPVEGLSFFGIEDPNEITSIAFGLANGGVVPTNGSSSFAITDLTIAADPVPEASTCSTLTASLILLATFRNRGRFGRRTFSAKS
jgi:hypothetical protein